MNKPLKRLLHIWSSFQQPVKRLLQATPYLYRVRNDPELREVSRCYVHWLPLCLFSEPGRWLRQLLLTRHRYCLHNQRPYDVYVPHLKALPFHNSPDNCRKLESRWREIYAEYLGIVDREGPPPNQAHVLSGRWATYDLIAMGHRDGKRAHACPVTLEVVSKLPVVDMVTFSSLSPGTHLRPHYGPTNIKLRHQLCLESAEGARIRVGDEWRGWRQGECNVIDDSFDHEVVHAGDSRRVVMLVDCWHPDLGTREREFLSELYRIWRWA